MNPGLEAFLTDLMRRRGLALTPLAAAMGFTHPSLIRWLRGDETPSPRSCVRIADYAGVPVALVLGLAGHVTSPPATPADMLPEFREYLAQKYPGILEEDLIGALEGLIEQRRGQRRI